MAIFKTRDWPVKGGFVSKACNGGYVCNVVVSRQSAFVAKSWKADVQSARTGRVRSR